MRGHLQSSTRRLNRHWQSGGGRGKPSTIVDYINHGTLISANSWKTFFGIKNYDYNTHYDSISHLWDFMPFIEIKNSDILANKKVKYSLSSVDQRQGFSNNYIDSAGSTPPPALFAGEVVFYFRITGSPIYLPGAYYVVNVGQTQNVTITTGIVQRQVDDYRRGLVDIYMCAPTISYEIPISIIWGRALQPGQKLFVSAFFSGAHDLIVPPLENSKRNGEVLNLYPSKPQNTIVQVRNKLEIV